MKNTLCWKMCAGKQAYSSLNRVNKAWEYQIKPENKVSYFCLVWEQKNGAQGWALWQTCETSSKSSNFLKIIIFLSNFSVPNNLLLLLT